MVVKALAKVHPMRRLRNARLLTSCRLAAVAPGALLDPSFLLDCPGTWVRGMPWKEPRSDTPPASAPLSHDGCSSRNFAQRIPVLQVLKGLPTGFGLPALCAAGKPGERICPGGKKVGNLLEPTLPGSAQEDFWFWGGVCFAFFF